jgi:cyclopropane-fatty-acyl-phospholipid synthase
VGEKYWGTYFDKVSELLSKKGKAVIQTITMNEDDFDNYRKGSDFIRSFIFPGGMLPSMSKFKEKAAASGLVVTNTYAFGQDYARTLRQWLNQFDAKIDAVKNMGFDDEFIRLWRFYLAACAAGFHTGRTDVMQVELVHA